MNVEHNCLFGKADACRIPLADSSCDLVIGSPPYLSQRLYLENGENVGIARDCVEWVEWMMRVTQEAIRVSRGLVLWVCAGPTQDRNYQPGPEGLVWEWYRSGGYQECPCYWHRVGICGSGGNQWFRKDVEYVLAFKKTPVLPYSDNTACGHIPKWAPGGEMSHRISNGTRRNQWGQTGENSGLARERDGSRQKPGVRSHVFHTKRSSDATMEPQKYTSPSLANPGNWLDITVGGGQLGSQWAHESEAPYPVGVPEHFIKSFTKLGDVVCDPFSGSGTTCESANNLGRIGIGFDLRMSQCRIGQQRVERPHMAILPSKKKDKPFLLLGETE